MSLNEAASAERIHIGFFGKRNAGKSSLVNAVTNQEVSLVSKVKGTTTDPVKKSMELLPLGPVVIVDTPGIDDEGELGEMRIKKAFDALQRIDIAVLVIDSKKGKSHEDELLIEKFKERKLPYLLAFNKADLLNEKKESEENEIYLSALKGEGIEELKNALARFSSKLKSKSPLISDLISPGDFVVLVIPIDASAPKGRLILPQQQTLREILDSNCVSVSCQVKELSSVLAALSGKVKLVVTDSQAFKEVCEIVPDDIPLTSFSILFARYKGELDTLKSGTAVLDELSNGDEILISEGCTHHRQCGDIGRDKIPFLIQKYSGKNLHFSFSSGQGFPDDLSKFRAVIHCGGCMLTEREMERRIEKAKEAKVPILNYGMTLSKVNGILERSLKIFEA